MMSADPALALAVAYLRLNGYFLLTEQELHIREPVGFRTLTDIDIIALRPPTARGPAHHHLGQGVEECLIVTDRDPDLEIDTTRFDIIIGEVKTAEGGATTPTARVRLVAFAGHGRIGRGTTVHLGDTARFIHNHLASRHDLYRVTRFSDPVIALLELLAKVH